MMDLAVFKTDKELESSGVWHPVHGDCRILVARANNVNYKRVLAELYQPNAVAISMGGEVAQKIMDAITTKAMAKTILLGWENITLDGEPLEYSEENAFKVLSDPKYEDFRELVATLSLSRDYYKGVDKKK